MKSPISFSNARRGGIANVATPLVAFGVVLCYAPSLSADCPSPWSDLFSESRDFSLWGDHVRALTVFDDDGDGPHPPMLFAGGYFSVISGAPNTSGIAKWDGRTWSSVGGGIPAGGNSGVNCLKVFDEDGAGPMKPALIAGGLFTSAGGLLIQNLARWDGTTWSAVGGNPDARVWALESFDDDGDGPRLPALYAGGHFDSIGGTAASRIAKYEAGSWTSLGSGIRHFQEIRAMTVFDQDQEGPVLPNLIVGGYFEYSGSVSSSMIAKWDGASWDALGGGLNSTVNCLAVHDEDGLGPLPPALYAGGAFVVQTSEYVAKWDGANWLPVGNGVDYFVQALLSVDLDENPMTPAMLYAAGELELAIWNGIAWSWPATFPTGFSRGYALAVFHEPYCNDTPSLFLGGAFGDSNRNPGPVAKFNGTSWNPVRTGLNDEVHALVVVDLDGEGPDLPTLLVGGGFTSAGPTTATGLGLWDGQCWTQFSEQLGGQINAICAYDEDGAGPNQPTIFAGADPYGNASLPGTGLVKWSGSNWDLVGGVSFSLVNALTVYDDDGGGSRPPGLYIGGSFLANDGDEYLDFIARWDGTDWSPVPNLWGTVNAMTVFDEDGPGPSNPNLYVGGDFFIYSESEQIENLAKWDGQTWSAVGIPPLGYYDRVLSLTVFDPDGNGPESERLVAGGYIEGIGGITASNIAQWHGGSWLPLGSGVNGGVYTLCVLDQDGDGPNRPALYAGGSFSAAGGHPANILARWDGAAWTALGSGLDGVAYSITTFDDDGDGPTPPALYIGGDFTTAGGVSSGRIARWDPQYEAPAWYEEPLDRSAPVGSRVLFTGSATSGQDLTYRWRKDGVPLSDDARIYGTNTPLLTIQSVSALDEGDYDLETNNECASVISQSAHLTVCENDPNGDVNDDGVIDGRDIRVFVQQAFAANPWDPLESTCRHASLSIL